MNAKTCALLLLVVAVGFWAAPLRAQDGDTIVAGMGVGPYAFSRTDDVRVKTTGLGARNQSGSGHLYLEWYPQESLGVGLRYLLIALDDYGSYYIAPTVFHVHRYVDVQNILVTAQWLPFDPRAYTRPGLMAGVGTSKYHARWTMDGATVVDETASGGVGLLGAFVDLGAEDFGVRFGLSWLTMSLETVHTVNFDATGVAGSVELRWAF